MPGGLVFVSMDFLTLGSKNKRQARNDNDGGGSTFTRHELLATNPAISVYECGLSDENMNVLQVGHHEEDRTSRLGIDVLQDSV